MASKRSKYRITLSSLQICRSKQTSALAPLPKNIIFSPYNLKSLEISYPNLPEPPPSTPTDLSGIWDAAPSATEEHESRSSRLTMGGKGVRFESSRFKKEGNNNKDICSSSEEPNEERESLFSSLPTSEKWISNEICRNPMNSLQLKRDKSSKKSGLEKMIPCIEDGKVEESYAVLKRSKSPVEDFKKSMMEMIVEKKMCEVEDLEELLSCFLSLNSCKHHGAIVSAFTEVWMALFSQSK